MNCESARRQFSLSLYGELSFDEEELLEQHLETCGACQAELDAVRRMHAAVDAAERVPPPAVLGQCRRELRLRIHEHKAAAGTGLLGRLRSSLPAFEGWLKPAGAVALVAIGFFGSQLATRWAGREAPAPGLVASRVRYIEPQQQGTVRLVVEETRQKMVTGSLNEDHIRRLLLAAVEDPANPGLRVETVELLKNESGAAEVRRALLQALQRDTNPGVRLKALEALKPFAAEAEVWQTLARILLTDDNAGVRTQAIDALIQHKGPEIVGALQDVMRTEDNSYIRQRTQRALRDMKASVETF